MSFKPIEQFVSAEKRGDGGSALENAHLGRILGFNTYMGQNVNGISTGADTNTVDRRRCGRLASDVHRDRSNGQRLDR
jgi:hypothetical protein